MSGFFKTKNGHEMASQSPDFDDNCRKSNCGTRRVHLRPPRGPGRPKLNRKSPQKVWKIIGVSVSFPNCFSNPMLLLRGCWGYIYMATSLLVALWSPLTRAYHGKKVTPPWVGPLIGHERGPQGTDLDENFGTPYSFTRRIRK